MKRIALTMFVLASVLLFGSSARAVEMSGGFPGSSTVRVPNPTVLVAPTAISAACRGAVPIGQLRQIPIVRKCESNPCTGLNPYKCSLACAGLSGHDLDADMRLPIALADGSCSRLNLQGVLVYAGAVVPGNDRPGELYLSPVRAMPSGTLTYGALTARVFYANTVQVGCDPLQRDFDKCRMEYENLATALQAKCVSDGQRYDAATHACVGPVKVVGAAVSGTSGNGGKVYPTGRVSGASAAAAPQGAVGVVHHRRNAMQLVIMFGVGLGLTTLCLGALLIAIGSTNRGKRQLQAEIRVLQHDLDYAVASKDVLQLRNQALQLQILENGAQAAQDLDTLRNSLEIVVQARAVLHDEKHALEDALAKARMARDEALHCNAAVVDELAEVERARQTAAAQNDRLSGSLPELRAAAEEARVSRDMLGEQLVKREQARAELQAKLDIALDALEILGIPVASNNLVQQAETAVAYRQRAVEMAVEAALAQAQANSSADSDAQKQLLLRTQAELSEARASVMQSGARLADLEVTLQLTEVNNQNITAALRKECTHLRGQLAVAQTAHGMADVELQSLRLTPPDSGIPERVGELEGQVRALQPIAAALHAVRKEEPTIAQWLAYQDRHHYARPTSRKSIQGREAVARILDQVKALPMAAMA